MAWSDLLYSGMPDSDVRGGDSVHIAEGFLPMQKTLEALTQAVTIQTQALKALGGMERNFGTQGSSGYATNVDGTNALYGQTTVQSLREKAGSTAKWQAPERGWGDWTPVASPVDTSPAQASPATFGTRARAYGGQLAAAGFAAMNPTGWNPRAGQTSTGGGGGTVPPAGGSGGGGGRPRPPVLSGGSGGGTGGSGGLYGGLMSSMQKVPAVGTALGIVDEIQSQRQKNAYYQNIEGGSNLHGFGERYNEALGQFTTMGMFAPGEYSALYKDATKLGYTDRSDGKFQSRQGAMDFGYQNKSAMGMDAQESAQYLTTASRSAGASFQELSSILEQVSTTAGKAGVNANMMRQSFNALWQSNLNSGLTGSAAMQTAGATSQFQAGMGRQFQNSDFSKATSVGMNYMVASTNGLTGNQFLAVANANPAAAAAMREKTQNMGLDALINAEMKTWIKQQVQNLGGPDAIEQDKTLARRFWPQFLARYASLDWYAVKAQLQFFSGGTFASDTDAFEYLVQWVMGKDPNQILMQKSKDAQIKGGSSQVKLDDLGTDWTGATSGAGSAYMKWSMDNKKTDPVLEAVLTGMNRGGVSQNDQMVQVTSGGQQRVVSMATAVANYGDQIANGTAKFKGGPLDGEDASVYGTIDQSASRMAAARDEANKGNANVGQALSDYNDAAKKATASGSSTTANGVTIGLSPQAAKLLTIQTANDQNVSPNTLGPQTDLARGN